MRRSTSCRGGDAGCDTGLPSWQAGSIAEIYREQGSYIHAIETLKRAVQTYFSTRDWPDPTANLGEPFSAGLLG